MVPRPQLQTALQKPYDRILFSKEVLSPVFGSCFALSNSAVPASEQPNRSEQIVIQSVYIYGNIYLEDGTEITCYEITLQPTVRIEHNKVAIQRYVRKLLTAGQIALVNFIAPQNKKVWRLTLVAKDSELTDQGIKEKTTHAKRYTYLLGPSETCKTAAERFETLSTEKQITFQALVNAFSVEKLSKAFFDEYTRHYQKFCDYLQESDFRKSVFKISISPNTTKEEKDKACKPIRDFVKKLLGRIVFLYFVQKKGWLGASDTNYKDGLTDFIKQLFKQSGGNDVFYSTWLTVLFFETLNKDRRNDDFKMPDGKEVKVPFLNGGLFDREDHDEHILTFKSKLFHNPDFEDTILTEKNKDNARGFLDFLDAFNFTVHEDSPDDHTVAVDPEMLGHIFENLLEDNKDKGAFYTPKEIVHYMCQESLTEYLTTHLSKEYTVYKEIGNQQVELFGNEIRTGQLKMVEQLGEKALNRDDVAYIVKHKDISHLTQAQLKKIDTLLDTVKICDPAIGSGAFPMGLLQEIHAIKEAIAYELQQPWKPADVKENIIQNSVYGVDIEKGAVDIARLRFWLSLVVDEEKPRALPNLDYKIVVGDSLVSKFEGEIIEIDWERKTFNALNKTVQKVQQIEIERQNLLKEIASKQKQFFKPDNKDKKKLQAEIRNLKLELLINQLSFNKEKFLANNFEKGGFAPSASDLRYNEELKQKRKDFDRQIAKLQKLKQNEEEPFEHFDWKLDFPEVLNPYLVNGNAGFDIVIGNPPYIEFKKLPAEAKANFGKYKSASRKYDIFCLFIELSSWISKNEGVHCFINPTTFLMKDFGIPLRDLIRTNFKIIEIFDFADYQIFETAITYTGIFVFKKVKSATNYTFYYQKLNSKEKAKTRELLFLNKESSNFKEVSNIEFHNLQEDSWIFGSESSSELLSLIEKGKRRLKEFTKYIFVGIQSGKDEVFFVNSETIKEHKLEKQIIFPILKGKDVKKYSIDWSGTYLIYPYDKKTNSVIEEKQFKSQFPNTYKYLLDNRNNLKGRAYFDKSNKQWYELWCERNLTKFLETKIVNAEISPENRFQIDYSGIFGNTKIFSTVLKKEWSEYYLSLLAILNSSLMNYYHKKIASPKAGGFYDYKTQFIQTYPILLPTSKDVFDRLVSYVIFLKSQSLFDISHQLMPTYFEQIIDGMVYELYFPELIKKHKREIIEHLGELPEFTDKMNDEQKMGICKSVFNRLNDREHPVRVNLFYMNSIPEIAIIEGKNENN